VGHRHHSSAHHAASVHTHHAGGKHGHGHDRHHHAAEHVASEASPLANDCEFEVDAQYATILDWIEAYQSARQKTGSDTQATKVANDRISGMVQEVSDTMKTSLDPNLISMDSDGQTVPPAQVADAATAMAADPRVKSVAAKLYAAKEIDQQTYDSISQTQADNVQTVVGEVDLLRVNRLKQRCGITAR